MSSKVNSIRFLLFILFFFFPLTITAQEYRGSILGQATNTAIFGSPSSDSPQTAPVRTSVADPNQPGAWSGFGTIGSTQQNFPRQMQMSLKLLF